MERFNNKRTFIRLIESGIEKKDAIKLVAKERNLPKKRVYKYSTEL